MASPIEVARSPTTCNDSALSSEPRNDVIMADNFPSKAFLLVEYCHCNDADVASWSDDGANFIVKDTSKFSSTYLPQYFKSSKFSSFVRQLNTYGFNTVKQDPECSTGDANAAVFHHEFFQRSRSDLLSNIKRSKKSHRSKKKVEQQSPAEEKKDGCYEGRRFDEIQLQMDDLSRKLDLLISLVSGNPDYSVNQYSGCTEGSKRRRQDVSYQRVSSPSSQSSVTEPTSGSDDLSSHSSTTSSSTGSSKRHIVNLEVLKEHEEYEPISVQYKEETHQQQALDDTSRDEDGDEFLEFISTVLDGGENNASFEDCDDCSNEDECIADIEMGESSVGTIDDGPDLTFVADPLRTKTSPNAVEGEQQIPQTTATVTGHHEVTDERVNAYDPSLPLTTAIEVDERKPRRLRLFLAVVVILALIAFIIWPILVFRGNSRQKKKFPPPPVRPRPPRNETFLSHHQELKQPDGVSMEMDSRSSSSSTSGKSSIFEPTAPDETKELHLVLNSQAYECNAVP